MNVRRALAATLAAALAAACGGSSESTPDDPCAGGADDGDACTVDACDPDTGEVTHDPVAVDDGDACTADSCDPIAGVLNDAIDPDDGDACTVDSCDPASGVANVPVAVDDGDACSVDACDPVAGVSHVPVTVDDGVACTVDSCDPAAGVQHDPDHLACTAGQYCDPGAGCASAGVVEDCIVSFPIFFTTVSGQLTRLVYGRVYSAGATEPDGPSDRVVAEVGYGAQGTDPAVGWTWFAASYRRPWPPSDDYEGSMLAPAPGTYDYAYRMSVDAGRTFTYCDTAGIYDPASGALGTMTVTP